MKLGAILRKLRNQKRLSQYYVAEQIGICQSTYFNWENERASPNAKYIAKLAEFFGVGLQELVFNDMDSVAPMSGGSNQGHVILNEQTLCENLITSQQHIITLQQQRIEWLEMEIQRLTDLQNNSNEPV